MASTKTFADLKKPVRQPTPEQIAAFEETGRASPSVNTETRKAANAESRAGVNTEGREHDNVGTRIPAEAESREHGNPPSQKPADTDSQFAAKPAPRKSVDTETRISGSVVRLTIDLSEPAHTRFKTACAMTKRKMVDEVRAFIERRTAELEEDAGRA